MAESRKGYLTRSKTSMKPHDPETDQNETSADILEESMNAQRISRAQSNHSANRSKAPPFSINVYEEEVRGHYREEMAKLVEEEEELTSKMDSLEIELDEIQSLIAEAREILANDDVSIADKEVHKTSLNKLKRDLNLKKKEIALQKIEDKKRRSSIVRKRGLIQDRANLEKMKISEAREQFLGSDEEKEGNLSNHTVDIGADLENLWSMNRNTRARAPSEKSIVIDNTKDTNQMEHEKRALVQQLQIQREETKRRQEEMERVTTEAAKREQELEQKIKSLSVTLGDSTNVDNPTTASGSDERLIEMFAQAIGRATVSTSQSDSNRRFMARQSNAKDLPPFSGRAEDWPIFIAEYKRTSEDCGFSLSENMTRLRKCLKGEAYAAVQSLLMTPENLEAAVKKLERRFGDPDHIIEALINKARKISPFRDYQLDQLIGFEQAVTNLTATLQVMKHEAHLQNPYLIKELESKLPTNLQVQWREWCHMDSSRKRTLLHFSEWIDLKSRIACELRPVKAMEDPESKPRNNNYGKQQQKVYAVEEVPKVKVLRSCKCCNKEDHPIWNCEEFKNMKIDLREKLLKEKKLCISCLGIGHVMKDCRFLERKCGLDGCNKGHHRLLHKSERSVQIAKIEQPTEPVNTLAVVKPELILKNENGSNTLMGIIEVNLSGSNGKSIKVYAYVDPGSSIDLMEEDVRIELGIVGELSPLCTKGMNQTKVHEESRFVDCKISGTYQNAKTFELRNVRTVNDIGLSRASQSVEELRKRWPHLNGLPIKSFQDVKPKLLIGSGSIYLTTSLKNVGGQVGPVAMKSRLGWFLGGLQHGSEVQVNEPQVLHVCENQLSNERLHLLVKKYFAVEEFGVQVLNEKNHSKEDVRALKLIEETTKRIQDGERYETGLLWKSPNIILPESKNTAVHRLSCQERKMDRSPEFAKAYCDKMEEYLRKGYIQKLEEEELKRETTRDWYLPHFGVYNVNKPGKIRLVFDAAATSHGVSLNDALMQGPDLNNSLLAVLIRFRQHEIAFAGDICDMFHRVMIRDEDRASQKFLWRGMDRDKSPDVYQMNVMVFGATCSPSSAQFVKNANAEDFKDKYPVACQAIKRKFYVDDYLDSTSTIEEAQALIRDVIKINKKASFSVCNWTSNSKEVMESIPEELRAKEWKNMNICEETMEAGRVLGLWWDNGKDIFTFKLNFHKVPVEIVNGSRKPTKREILKLVMSVFDPLGFVAHLVIKAKILLQDVWRGGFEWDQELSEDLFDRWKNWLLELTKIPSVEIPRCYSRNSSNSEENQLHILCDASEKAFSAIAFLRVKADNDNYKVNIVCAKTRVAPLKPISIPRLELQAALMGARLAKVIKDELELKINRTVYWTDSSTVLRWLRNDARRFKQFVSHRLGEILESSDVNEWRWIPTAVNVADDATRDIEESDISKESRWFRGPAFLKQEECEWPMERNEVFSEVKGEDLEEKVNVLMVQEQPEIVPDIRRFSRYWPLIRVTAWARRFISNFKLKKGKKNSSVRLSVKELIEAERSWYKKIQHQSFETELRLINGGKPLLKSSKLFKLSPFIDKDKIIRMKGRMQGADNVSNSIKNPIILEGDNPFVKLLVEYFHVKKGHQGKNAVANELRQSFWILGLMKIVKSVARRCVFCQKRLSKPIVTEMGNLPAVRMESHIRPFTNCGLDYFGPMIVKEGRRRVKCWGVLFTCMSSRAVHLEVAGSLDTDSAIMAIKRMSCRRGQPHHIYSDNGTNFHGANNELKKVLGELNQEQITDKLGIKGTQWHFIPPAAPHMGGVWERMVGCVKKTLEGLMTAREVSKEVLETLLTEVEFIVNSRPLTEVSVDPQDPEALTPNHFLIGWNAGNNSAVEEYRPDGLFEESDLYRRQQWRQVQRLADMFWGRWVKEFLPTLTKRSKWFQSKDEVKSGDIVIVVDDQAPRNTWKMGRVMTTFPGKDGVARVVDVKTENGTYRRPVAKLCKLKIEVVDDAALIRGKNVPEN